MDNKDGKTNEEPNLILANNFQTIYSLQNNGVQDQGPFISTTTVNNFYNILPYGINAELLVRNKSKNGSFTDNLQVNGRDIVEFKLSITNTSTTETLSEVDAQVTIQNNGLEEIGIPPTASMGDARYSFFGFNLSSVKNLSPGGTVVATYELIVKYSGNITFSGYVDISGDRYNLTKRRFNFSKLPSLSIINAPLYSQNPNLSIQKTQKLIQANIQNTFSYVPMNVINGDIIEIEIYVISISTTVYNIKLTDKLSNNLSYISNSFSGKYYIFLTGGSDTTVNSIWGNPIFNSENSTNINGKIVGGSIEWNIPRLVSYLDSSSKDVYAARLYFQCEVVG